MATPASPSGDMEGPRRRARSGRQRLSADGQLVRHPGVSHAGYFALVLGSWRLGVLSNRRLMHLHWRAVEKINGQGLSIGRIQTWARVCWRASASPTRPTPRSRPPRRRLDLCRIFTSSRQTPHAHPRRATGLHRPPVEAARMNFRPWMRRDGAFLPPKRSVRPACPSSRESAQPA